MIAAPTQQSLLFPHRIQPKASALASRAWRPLLTAPLLFLAFFLTAPVQAQMSSSEVKAEIAFARGLAADWTFVDLAQSVLATVEKQGISGKAREELELVKCEVFVSGARSEPDAIARLALFESAFESYQLFIDGYSNSDFKSQAETGLVNTASIYGRAIDLALEESVGEKATELIKNKVEVLTDTVFLTQDLIDSLASIPEDERTEANRRELAGLMLNRGQMLGEIGRIEEEGEANFNRALTALEDMIWEFGEESVPGIRGFKAMADIHSYRGHYPDASRYYKAIISNVLPLDPKRWDRLIEANGREFNTEEIAFRFTFLELGTPGIVRTYQEMGETKLAADYALHMYNWQRKEGLQYTREGYQALLDVAKALLDIGGYIGGNQATGEAQWFATEEEMKSAIRSKRQHDDTISFSLKIANLVNQENKGNILQVRAQKLISVISTKPGMIVSPDVLLQAAQGEYFDGNYDAAIAGLHRVLAALDSHEDAERLQYGAQIMNLLANAHRRSDRELEAAMAFREGVIAWQGDPEQDQLNSQGYLSMIKKVVQRNPGDTTLDALKTEAENLVTRYGKESKADEIHFNRGMKKYASGDFDGASEDFDKINADADYYERARVQQAVCDFRAKRIDAALAAFDEYIDVFVTDPAHTLESPVRKAKRTEALAAAEFFRGLGLWMQAKQSNDQAQWARIDELLVAYPSKYPTQDVLVPWTMQMVFDSRQARGDQAGARQMIDTMLRDWPDNKRTGSSSGAYYNALLNQRKEMTGEESRAVLSEMANFLQISNSLGSAPFKSLRNESRHWLDLGNFTEAERVLTLLVTTHGQDPDQAGQMRTYILPDLGRALLFNGKVADAKAILNPLVMDADASPSKATVLTWARCISGWLSGADLQIKEIPGAGGTEEEWGKLITKLDQISKAGDKWISCEWYEVKLMVIYSYFTWSKTDSRKLVSAKKQLAQMDSFFDDPTYAAVEQYCAEAEGETRQRLGAGVLKSRYIHMARLLR
ncbi:MAG TPA: hypothetical protein EYQ74_01880 [Planctomycetes bacterium]|nr:hypothetical protein [Planctomycetota bacterium]HIK61475.1 hypothetical protein [Planctomycetota bacterium]